jgi:hypothetical protein
MEPEVVRDSDMFEKYAVACKEISVYPANIGTEPTMHTCESAFLFAGFTVIKILPSEGTVLSGRAL